MNKLVLCHAILIQKQMNNSYYMRMIRCWHLMKTWYICYQILQEVFVHGRAMTIISVILGRTFHYVDEILPFRYVPCDKQLFRNVKKETVSWIGPFHYFQFIVLNFNSPSEIPITINLFGSLALLHIWSQAWWQWFTSWWYCSCLSFGKYCHLVIGKTLYCLLIHLSSCIFEITTKCKF